jgi:hypothetical protein
MPVNFKNQPSSFGLERWRAEQLKLTTCSISHLMPGQEFRNRVWLLDVSSGMLMDEFRNLQPFVF